MPPTSSSASPQSLSLATQQMAPNPSGVVFSLPHDKHRSISSSLLICALQFFQQTREPQSSLPCEVTTPSAWNPLISNLASLPPAQTATHMPPPHQPQPAPANALNTSIAAEEISLGLHQLHDGRAGALQEYSSESLRYAKPLPAPEPPAPANLINPCIQASFTGNTGYTLHTGNLHRSFKFRQIPINGGVPLLPPSSTETPQTLPTTDRLQLGSHYANYK